MSNWIGQSVSRVEDERLLKGQGRYLADVKIPGTLEARTGCAGRRRGVHPQGHRRPHRADLRGR